MAGLAAEVRRDLARALRAWGSGGGGGDDEITRAAARGAAAARLWPARHGGEFVLQPAAAGVAHAADAADAAAGTVGTSAGMHACICGCACPSV